MRFYAILVLIAFATLNLAAAIAKDSDDGDVLGLDLDLPEDFAPDDNWTDDDGDDDLARRGLAQAQRHKVGMQMHSPVALPSHKIGGGGDGHQPKIGGGGGGQPKAGGGGGGHPKEMPWQKEGYTLPARIARRTDGPMTMPSNKAFGFYDHDPNEAAGPGSDGQHRKGKNQGFNLMGGGHAGGAGAGKQGGGGGSHGNAARMMPWQKEGYTLPAMILRRDSSDGEARFERDEKDASASRKKISSNGSGAGHGDSSGTSGKPPKSPKEAERGSDSDDQAAFGRSGGKDIEVGSHPVPSMKTMSPVDFKIKPGAGGHLPKVGSDFSFKPYKPKPTGNKPQDPDAPKDVPVKDKKPKESESVHPGFPKAVKLPKKGDHPVAVKKPSGNAPPDLAKDVKSAKTQSHKGSPHTKRDEDILPRNPEAAPHHHGEGGGSGHGGTDPTFKYTGFKGSMFQDKSGSGHVKWGGKILPRDPEALHFGRVGHLGAHPGFKFKGFGASEFQDKAGHAKRDEDILPRESSSRGEGSSGGSHGGSSGSRHGGSSGGSGGNHGGSAGGSHGDSSGGSHGSPKDDSSGSSKDSPSSGPYPGGKTFKQYKQSKQWKEHAMPDMGYFKPNGEIVPTMPKAQAKGYGEISPRDPSHGQHHGESARAGKQRPEPGLYNAGFMHEKLVHPNNNDDPEVTQSNDLPWKILPRDVENADGEDDDIEDDDEFSDDLVPRSHVNPSKPSPTHGYDSTPVHDGDSTLAGAHAAGDSKVHPHGVVPGNHENHPSAHQGGGHSSKHSGEGGESRSQKEKVEIRLMNQWG